ncbi:hypothetical protein CDAR_485981 [Caerostris darwini]|uniref:Uncharacterized protein n=1 Tax=Caerostris darwini TaxID=1538125 RepID=A0AAV4WMC4_9ARAC|nr:hypothetical protein CDAR_485981 [Caerostris darwini]
MFLGREGCYAADDMFFGESRQQQGVDDETVSKTRDACAEASFSRLQENLENNMKTLSSAVINAIKFLRFQKQQRTSTEE